MSGHKNLWVVLVVAALLVAGCAAGAAIDGEVIPPSDEGGLQHAPSLEAQAMLASELGVEQNDITVVSEEQVVWTDSCLGLGGPAESCLLEDTPGWLVILEAEGDQYEAHMNDDGTVVRFAE